MSDTQPQLSTQELNPKKTVVRTGLQVGVPAFLTLLVLVPEIIKAVLDGVGGHLPPDVYAWLFGAASLITAISMTIAKVMLIPGVAEWIRTYAKYFAPDDTPGRHEA